MAEAEIRVGPKPWSDGTTGITLSPLELLESWQRSYPCRASISCAMLGVWRRTVCCAGRSSRCRASRGWMGATPVQGRLAGAGCGCWGACSIWIWPRVPIQCAEVAHSASLPL